ncbi:hypothetical protein CLV40_11542 [Actinokineospora auranticolor]|uniref:ABC-type branched-subunit amino acid transport system substrate-binding protein n=1 Tax=Actinokineospora auranticolor TaxID=155976 RepID=A0A2S6GIZ9_9PSEU|nr:hypothetical protein CLV40_11542 [Actinokineospora auranticolor]
MVVGGLLTAAGLWYVPRWLGTGLPELGIGVSVRLVDTPIGVECVGYSDRSGQTFGDSDWMRTAQRAVFEMNETAARLHAESPARPLVSVIYLSELTKPEGQVGADDSTVEQLTGLLLLQAWANQPSDHPTPVLRVVIANAGFLMSQAGTAVDLITPLLEQDRSVLGVVGMSRTVDSVEQAITRLGDLGVPVVGTTLTGTGLTNRSPLYFQVIPDNHQEAALVQRYAAEAGKALTVYQPESVDGDGYLASLHDELAQLVRAEDLRLWRDVALVDPVCGADRIAFFAGRQPDFDRFLDQVLDVCGKDLPTVIGDDTVARFVAQQAKRANPKYSGKSITYVSLGPLTVLRNRDCLSDGTTRATPLCAGLRDLTGGRPLALLRLPDVRDFARPPECVLIVNADATQCR